MIKSLREAGAEVIAFDPEAIENVKERIGDDISYASNAYDALDGADALVILTEWSVFRSPDFDIVAEKLNNKAVFDGRNLFQLSIMNELGFHYESIGRNKIINK